MFRKRVRERLTSRTTFQMPGSLTGMESSPRPCRLNWTSRPEGSKNLGTARRSKRSAMKMRSVPFGTKKYCGTAAPRLVNRECTFVDEGKGPRRSESIAIPGRVEGSNAQSVESGG